MEVGHGERCVPDGNTLHRFDQREKDRQQRLKTFETVKMGESNEQSQRCRVHCDIVHCLRCGNGGVGLLGTLQGNKSRITKRRRTGGKKHTNK